jgi:uncharacterized protein (TIGR03000 family)
MVSQRLPIVTRLLAAVVVSLASTLPCAGHGGGGHGGGAGHVLGGFGPGRGFRGGFGRPGFFGYPGLYGFPWYGFGLGLGLGYGLGYGFGGYGGYGYGGYGYGGYGYPYMGGYGYPVYGGPGYGAPPAAACAVAGQGVPAGPAPGAPIQLATSDTLLSIRVPPNATVRINGEKTSQNGPLREYLSSGLEPGRTYTFVVTAQWTAPNGLAVQLEQRVQVQGGQRRNVDFLMPFLPVRDVR